MTIPQPCRCVICARPLTLHEQYAGQVCSDWRCRERQLDEALQVERASAAQDLGLDRAEAFPIVVVPWRANRVVELPAERRSELKEFLDNLLSLPADAVDEYSAPSHPEVCAEQSASAGSPDPNGDALLAKVCAVCKGFCCFYGATRHAFLDGETMRQFRERHPGMPAEDVVAAYLRYLPEHHCESSCVYHTQTGCALPRTMRASICNTYECRGLKDARRGYAKTAVARACVVVRHDNRIISGAFVDISGAQPWNAVL